MILHKLVTCVIVLLPFIIFIAVSALCRVIHQYFRSKNGKCGVEVGLPFLCYAGSVWRTAVNCGSSIGIWPTRRTGSRRRSRSYLLMTSATISPPVCGIIPTFVNMLCYVCSNSDMDTESQIICLYSHWFISHEKV